MSPDERVLIERVLELAESNNKMLRSIHRAQTMSRILRIIYWLAILALTVGSYYALQPYIDLVKDNFGVMKANVENMSNALNEVNNIKDRVGNILK